jgi:hypothetical protein
MMRVKYSVAVGLFGLLLTPTVLLPASRDTPDPVGRPAAFRQGRGAMFGVWYQEGYWHLSMTSKERKGRKVFTGAVSVAGDRLAGQVEGLEMAKNLKKADWIFPRPGGRGFDFRFVTAGATDGVRFNVGKKATTVTFELHVGGDSDPTQILIGAKGTHPDKATFTLPAHPKE